MDISLSVLWWLNLNYKIDVLDIKTSRCYISGDQNLKFTFLKSFAFLAFLTFLACLTFRTFLAFLTFLTCPAFLTLLSFLNLLGLPTLHILPTLLTHLTCRTVRRQRGRMTKAGPAKRATDRLWDTRVSAGC